jgi:hypothetical protein
MTEEKREPVRPAPPTMSKRKTYLRFAWHPEGCGWQHAEVENARAAAMEDAGNALERTGWRVKRAASGRVIAYWTTAQITDAMWKAARLWVIDESEFYGIRKAATPEAAERVKHNYAYAREMLVRERGAGTDVVPPRGQS